MILSIFKAYDIRGVYPKELNEEIIYKIARAFASFTNAKRIVVGGDNRLSTPSLKESFIKGLLDSGAEVTDIGTIPTSMVYFACYKLGFEAGAMITASHNPKEFNGVKLCDSEGLAIGLENGTEEIKKLIEKSEFKTGDGQLNQLDVSDEYERFISKVASNQFKGLKIVIDGSNGSAGEAYTKIFRSLGANIVELFCNPDGNFPNHKVPDPLIEENLNEIKSEVIKTNADVGFALDGDGDRLVIIDEKGERVSPNHMLCLLAERYLQENGSGKIVYDVLSSQLVEEVIRQNNGIPIVSKVGHSIIPRVCKKEDAVLAGEVSAHFFFKEANYTDDTLVAATKLLDILKSSKKPLSELVEKYPKYHQVLEKRIPVESDKKSEFIENLKAKLQKEGYTISTLDGVKIKFEKGWAVFRASNTESKIAISYESPEYEEFKKIEKFVNDVIVTIPQGDNIKLIVFDSQDVLTNDWRDVFDVPELGIKSSLVAEFFDDHNELRKEMQYGRITEDEFWKQFIYFTGADVTVDQLKYAVRKVLRPVAEVLDIAKSLKENYKLVILSNFTKEWAEYLVKEYRFDEIFNYMFWSFQNGIKKPLPEAYLQIIKKFNVLPEECLFVDDKERNIKGAKEVGMKTIFYSNPEKLKKDLFEMGVKVGG